MTDRLADLEQQVAELRRVVDGLDRRLGVVESAGGTAAVAATVAEAPGAPPAVAAEHEISEPHAGRDLLAELGLVGRTLMALGGGFLLRALTESDRIADGAGVALGLAYALLWLGLAYRAGRGGAGRPGASGTFHALVFTLLAYPLLWEAAARFRVLPAAGAALALAAVTALALAVAAVSGLRWAAWLAVVGCVLASFALTASTGRAPLFAGLLLALAVAACWLSPRLGWSGLPWLTAAAADVAVLLVGVRWQLGRGDLGGAAVIAVGWALWLAFVGSFLLRSREPGWRVGPFVLLQTLAVLAVGFGGGLWVAAGAPELALPVGVASLAVAAGAAVGAWRLLGRRDERRPAFLYRASLAFVLVLGGTGLVLTGMPRTAVWAALVLLAAWLARRLASGTLELQSALFALAAAAASGLLRQGALAFAAPADHPWPPPTPQGLVVLAAIGVALALPAPERSAVWGRTAILPRLLLLAILAVGAGGAVLAVVAPLVAGGPPGADAGALAAVRTGVLALLAASLAGLGRWPGRFAAATRLAYPVLLLGALKLALEDFPAGRPATLFVALAIYGAVLILVPRWLRRGGRTGPRPGGAPPATPTSAP